MSISKESVVLVMLANLVLTILVVAGAMFIIKGEEAAEGGKPSSALEERIAKLESRKSGGSDLAGEIETLDIGNRLGSLEASQRQILAKLENLGSVGGGSLAGTPGDGTDPDATPKVPEGGEAMMKLVGQMMADRMKRERDRYIEMLRNPTPESEARQERMMRGMARRSARSLGLDDQQSVVLEEIVLEVDKMRRDRFLDLINSKSDPNEITKDEVQGILDESYEEEDRRVSQALPNDKADQYKKDAGGMRSMMNGVAGSMFKDDGDMK